MEISQQEPQNICMKIKYIDCRSWYDFGEELFTVGVAFWLFLRVAKHYRNLKKQKQQQAKTQHQKSVRRKIRVNLIQIIYLMCFIITTLFGLYLFFPYMYQPNTLEGQSKVLVKIYKICEVLYINWLNTLNLTVGFLYWKAARAYYVLSNLDVPFVFRRFFKKIFFLFFCFNASAPIVAACYLFIIGDILHEFSFKVVTLITTIISIIVCIGCRILFRQHILKKIDLSQDAITKQWVMSILLFISSLCRIALYTLDIVVRGTDEEDKFKQWQDSVRNQRYENGECLDTYPFYAMILLFINMVINLLPAAIYGHLFVSEVQTMKNSRNNRLLHRRDTDQFP